MTVRVSETNLDPLQQLLKTLPPPRRVGRKSKPNGLASAEMGDPRSLRAADKSKGLIYLGNESADTYRSLGLCNDSHVLVNGGTRSGKGVAFITANLLLWQGSAIVIDPKGENATVTARRRANGSAFCKGMGQKVYILAPFGGVGRADDPMHDLHAQFNPLKGLDPSDPHVIDLINEIVSSMVIVPDNADAKLWTQAARSLLKATILHVISSPDFAEGDRNLVTVYELLCHGDREKKDFLEEIGADAVPPTHLLLYNAMEGNPAFNGIIASAGETYSNLLTQAPKQYMGVIETLKSDLEFMDSPGMQECLLDSSFSLEDLKNDPHGITVYLCIPLSLLETHFRWLRVIITQAMNTMERQKYRPQSGWPVLFMLDEFAALKKMPALQNGIAQMAGHGLKFVLIVQDYNQLRHVYGDAWETFAGNCGVKLFLSTEDIFTREYASKLVGDAEIQVRNRNNSFGLNFSEVEGLSTSTANGETTGDSTTIGGSYGGGTSTGPGLFSFGSSRNWSRTSSTTVSTGKSITRTTSRSSSTSEGQSQTFGVQINWQTRPLIRPDEIGRFFAYKDEPGGVPFAGEILVLVTGEQAIAIRRTLYYRHICFEGLFDPHPEFPVEAAYRAPVTSKPLPLPDEPRPSGSLIIPSLMLSRRERFKRWLKDPWPALKRALTSKWGLTLLGVPLGFVTSLFLFFAALGMTEEFFILMVGLLINMFPSLLGV